MRNLRVLRDLRALVIVLGVVAFATVLNAASKSPLADAAERGDLAAVQALLAKKADVNAPQNDGSTALHWAVYRGDAAMANALIRAGANVKTANRDGSTPLWLASINGDAKTTGVDRRLVAHDRGVARLIASRRYVHPRRFTG